MSFHLIWDISEIVAEAKRLERAIPETHRDLQARIVGATIDDLVVRSPVLTGAYRAAHAVGIGADVPTKLVYDSPEHPIREVNYKPGAQPIFQVPDGELARAAYEQEAPYQRAVISNDRRYASDLEHGNAVQAPRAIYETAAANAELLTATLAKEGLDLAE